MKWVKLGAMILISLLIVGALIYGFIPKPIPSEFGTVRRGDVRETIDEEARTRVKDRFTIFAPVAGEITRVPFKPGAAIKAGDVITTLTPARPPLLDARARKQAEANIKSAEATLKQAESNVTAASAELELARKEFKRMQDLLKGRHVSQEQVDVAETRQQGAEAALESAKFAQEAAKFQREMAEAALIDHTAGELESIQIKSPVDGRVLQVFRESEGPIMPGAMLVEIGNPETLEIVAELLSTDAVRVEAALRAAKDTESGQVGVRIERWGGEKTLLGVVREVEPYGFTEISALGVEEQRVNVIIDFTGGPADYADLGDGYRVEARVVLSERVNVLTVPTGAIFDGEKGKSVFVVTDGVAVEKSVQLGASSGTHVEILSGVTDKDVVIVHPSDEIKNGSPVTER